MPAKSICEIQAASKIACTYEVRLKTSEDEIIQVVARKHILPTISWSIWYYKTGERIELELKDKIIAFIHQQEGR